MLVTILIFLVLLSILVLAHECGHYLTAKRAGMKVEEFGLGFPPRLYSWKNKAGMRWSINLIPLGGFVKIKGESGEDRSSPDSFANKSIISRMVVLISGVIMNLILAAILLSIGFAFGMPAVTEGGVSKSAQVSKEQILVSQILPDSPAAAAGIEVGDIILTVNGVEYKNSQELRDTFGKNQQSEVFSIQFDHQGQVSTVTVESRYLKEIDKVGVGLGLIQTGIVRYPWYLAPGKGIEATYSYVVRVIAAFYGLLRGMIFGEPVLQEVASPIGIAVITGEVAQQGIMYLLQFAAFLSVNLAVINAIPFPALDGGRIAFVLLEAVRRRRANPKVEAIVHNIGFALLILLVIIVAFKDIIKYF